MLNKSVTRIKSAILIWTIIINALFIFFAYQQVKGAEKIHDIWKTDTLASIEQALTLVKVEREIGYLGFIHHFKNYVIRKEDQYFQQANNSYRQAIIYINELKTTINNAQQLNALNEVKNTLDTYQQKLQFAYNNKTLTSNQLDKLVKVDDQPALTALLSLRQAIFSENNKKIEINDTQLSQSRNVTLIFSMVFLPFFIMGSIYSLRLVSKLSKLSHEQQIIFDTMADGIIFSNKQGRIINCNAAASQIFGYDDHEIQQLHIEDLIDKPIRAVHRELRREFHSKEQSRFMMGKSSAVFGIKKNGEHVDLSVAISTKKSNNTMYSIAIIRDTSLENEIKKQAELDHLTEINNRRSIEKIINKEISRSGRYNNTFSILLLDIDKFKELNDTQGHLAGDNAIKKIVAQVKNSIRDHDHLGRWGGDEFLIACPNLNTFDAITFAQRLCDDAAKTLSEADMPITISIGITTYSGEKTSYEELIKQADAALYHAKNNGRNQVAHHEYLANH